MEFEDDESTSGEENVYADKSREDLIENGEISPEEEAFMEGYDESEKEEGDSASEAYENAFKTRRRKK